MWSCTKLSPCKAQGDLWFLGNLENRIFLFKVQQMSLMLKRKKKKKPIREAGEYEITMPGKLWSRKSGEQKSCRELKRAET